MEISKKELKKTSRAFRTIASRVINAHYEEVNSLIKMLIDYVEGTPIIYEYIQSILNVDNDLEQEIESVINSYGRAILSVGSTPEEEVSTIYQMLIYIKDNPNVDTYMLGWGYTASNKYQDMVKEFGNRLVLPFVNQIDNYLMDIATDMGYDEESKFMINITGGQAQVNIANDQSTINATQNNQIKNTEIVEIIESIRKALNADNVESQIKDTINSNLDFIEEELTEATPKHSKVKAFLSTITILANAIPQAVQTIEGIQKLHELITPLI